MNETLKVVIVEDDIELATLLCKRVKQIPGVECINQFDSPVALLREKGLRVDVVLLDVLMPEMNGLDAIEPILEQYPNAAVIMNTIKDDAETIFEALKRGATGYIDKQSDDLSIEEILRVVSSGGSIMSPSIARKVIESFRQVKVHFESLTPRERDVTKGILDGKSYKMIGDSLGISIDTVRMNIKNIYKKLHINSKSQLFKIARDKFGA
ncbi:MAG: response regulator transcription factor [Sphingobacteriales bacterium]|nr:response regulator transcription factor [Sphingobacteriales bacterium]